MRIPVKVYERIDHLGGKVSANNFAGQHIVHLKEGSYLVSVHGFDDSISDYHQKAHDDVIKKTGDSFFGVDEPRKAILSILSPNGCEVYYPETDAEKGYPKLNAIKALIDQAYAKGFRERTSARGYQMGYKSGQRELLSQVEAELPNKKHYGVCNGLPICSCMYANANDVIDQFQATITKIRSKNEPIN